MTAPASRLAEILASRADAVIASWSHRYDRSRYRLPRPQDPRHYAGMVANLIEALAEAVDAPVERMRPGTPEVRELEKATSFVGAALAASGASGFEVAAVVLALRDTTLEFAEADLIAPVTELFEWLTVLAMDAHATSGTRAVEERAAEQLEAGTPVLLIAGEVPAAILLGGPTAIVVDAILGRAMMTVVRVGAASLIIDVSGVAEAALPAVTEAMSRFVEHKRMAPVEVLIVGAPGELAARWAGVAREHSVVVVAVDRFEAAVERALDRAGYQLVRRRR